MEQALIALLFGALSALALPIGAVFGIVFKPKDVIVAVIMAFGGGALLSALTLELIQPALKKGGYIATASGAVLGGLLFLLLNQLLNNKGGFLRKRSTINRYLRKKNINDLKVLFKQLSKVKIFNSLPAEEIYLIAPYIHQYEYQPNEILFQQGEIGDILYIIKEGKVDLYREYEAHDDITTNETEAEKVTYHKKVLIGTLGDGDIFGEMAIINNEKRNATVIAKEKLTVWKIKKDDFENLIKNSQKIEEAFNKLLAEHTQASEEFDKVLEADAKTWLAKASTYIDNSNFVESNVDLKKIEKEHNGAPFAIWLGILLDGIPESAVIGASLIVRGNNNESQTFSSAAAAALIVGVFLSNLPEAMSSAVGMRKMGYKVARIMIMWISIMIMTGIGAFFGNIFFQDASYTTLSIFEGMAAGAMLAMIAETMMPEAYKHGGATVGMSTLLGFLIATFVGTLGAKH